LTLVPVALLLSAMLAVGSAPAAGPMWGADLSSWPAIADRHPGIDPVSAWAGAGGDWIRLRVFHTSRHEHGGREQAHRLATRAKRHGLKVLLALHLSDTWADPGRQELPRAWRGLAPEVLADSLAAYVASITAGFAGRVDAVQIGNEIDPGILLPHGSFESAGATRLLRAATARSDSTTTIVMHVSGQAEGKVAAARVTALDAAGVHFDVVGLSWYPWWHGDLAALRRALDRVARAAGERRVWIVETAYPFTLGWADAEHNVVGTTEQLRNGPPATPAGQRAWFAAVADLVRAQPATDALFAWEPAWLAGSAPGSPWENLAWIDFAGERLPVWDLLSGVPPAPRKD